MTRCYPIRGIPQTVTVLIRYQGKRKKVEFNDPNDELKLLTGLEKRLFTLGADVVRLDRFNEKKSWFEAHYKKDCDMVVPEGNEMVHHLRYHRDDEIITFTTFSDFCEAFARDKTKKASARKYSR